MAQRALRTDRHSRYPSGGSSYCRQSSQSGYAVIRAADARLVGTTQGRSTDGAPGVNVIRRRRHNIPQRLLLVASDVPPLAGLAAILAPAMEPSLALFRGSHCYHTSGQARPSGPLPDRAGVWGYATGNNRQMRRHSCKAFSVPRRGLRP